ncbi:hypothetical protein [Rheinheimera maricola]|uniref:DUF3592 domain-containing protein n=1 Tax=Rheinheimera maricola TaxID=2793282 RepID=A0ABS7XB81_9GAMM|nr:hypothetical protein [Rheinheimera maricola]MBZ9611983.1 hypothetical protein [Rheinheimera maricola]
MKFTKEDIYAQLGLLIILAMSLFALLIIYHHYRVDFKWAQPVNDVELNAGQVRYWQYDTLHSVKQLSETSCRPSRRLSELEQGRYVSVSRVDETWALVQKETTLYLVQRFPSTNIPYGAPLQRFLDTFIEPEDAKYLVKPITPQQSIWLEQQLVEYPELSVQQDWVLQALEYPRTTVLLSVPFILLASFGLALTLAYYTCRFIQFIKWLAGRQSHDENSKRILSCQQQPKPIVIVATLLLLGYLLLLQLG